MSEFVKFKDRVFEKPGLYVLKRKDGAEEHVYASDPERHYHDVYSFMVTVPNYRDVGTIHDMGHYQWVNHVMSSDPNPPVAWREQTPKEAGDMRKQLFRFERPKPDWRLRFAGSGY